MLAGLLLSAALLSPSADPVNSPPVLPDIPIPALPGDPPGIPATLPPVLGNTQAPAAAPPMAVPNATTPGTVMPNAGMPNAAMPPGYAVITEPMAEPPAKKSLNDNHKGPSHTLWAEVDYALFFLKTSPNPNVLLQSTAANGVVTNLVGGGNDDFGRANGYRLNAGVWLDQCHTFGIGAGLFQVEQKAVLGAATTDAAGNPLLSRPYTDAVLAQPARALVSSPGTLTGSFFSRASSQLSGADLYAVYNLSHDKDVTVDLLFGGRYIDLDESIDLTQQTTRIGGPPLSFAGLTSPAITGVTINDHFRTRNQFYGATIGLRGEYRLGMVFLNATGKLGFGNSHQTIDIDGSSTAAGLALPAASSGLLAVTGGNVGRVTNNRFAVVTEVGVNVGVQVSRHARILMGYDFMYLGNVARPGAQIDPVVNTRLVPTSSNFGSLTGITSPVPTGKREDFYVNGIRFGVELLF